MGADGSGLCPFATGEIEVIGHLIIRLESQPWEMKAISCSQSPQIQAFNSDLAHHRLQLWLGGSVFWCMAL